MKVIQKLREIKRSFVLYCNILIQEKRHKSNLKKLRGKKTIKVAFFAIHSSVWKYDYLYHLMCEHPLFDPVIVVCPAVNYGEENMLREMDKCYNMFVSRGYNVIRTYDTESKEYLNIKKDVNPDIIFYTNPYKGLIDDRYYITKFGDVLTCYVSYNYGNSSLYSMFHNLELHNLVWRIYSETESHKKYSIKHAFNKGVNVVVSGYPGTDVFFDSSYVFGNVWKIKNTALKRIIWAPHHTVEENENICYSCFMKYAQFMFDIAVKYQNQIQIAFKPHPLLRVKLNRLWGESKTTEYYENWNRIPNGMLFENDYVDLFLSSDAMIHDCGSFITEYLYTCKPVLRTDNGRDLESEFNPFALECLSVYYHAKSKADVEDFIVDVIIGKDSLKEKRNNFFKNKLLPPNGQMASQNILDDIVKCIN